MSLSDLIRELARWALQQLIDVEAAGVIGAGRYERTEYRTNERNGRRAALDLSDAGLSHSDTGRGGCEALTVQVFVLGGRKLADGGVEPVGIEPLHIAGGLTLDLASAGATAAGTRISLGGA